MLKRQDAFIIMPAKRKPQRWEQLEESFRKHGPLSKDDEVFLAKVRTMSRQADFRNRMYEECERVERAFAKQPERLKARAEKTARVIKEMWDEEWERRRLEKERLEREEREKERLEEEEKERERLMEEEKEKKRLEEEERLEAERIRQEEEDARRREEINKLQRQRIADALRLQELKAREAREREEARKRAEEEQRRRREEERRREEQRARRQQERELREREREREKQRREQERMAQKRMWEEEQSRRAQEAYQQEAHQNAQERWEEFLRRARAQGEEQQRQAEAEAQSAATAQCPPAGNSTSVDPLQFFRIYDAKWEELRTKGKDEIPPIALNDLPWPVFFPVNSAQDITYERVREFVFHPMRPGLEQKIPKHRLRLDIVKWHPDKFNNTTLPRVREWEREATKEAAGEVAKFLNQLLAEVAS